MAVQTPSCDLPRPSRTPPELRPAQLSHGYTKAYLAHALDRRDDESLRLCCVRTERTAACPQEEAEHRTFTSAEASDEVGRSSERLRKHGTYNRHLPSDSARWTPSVRFRSL